ncbi:MAG: hypothetical protein ACYCQK_08290 [Acidiferrobacteraceae bacterium]
MTAPSDIPFHTRLQGYFVSLLTWQQLASFWEQLLIRADAGWYVYAVGESVPATPRTGPEVAHFIREVDALLRRDHGEDYCGIVYTDSRTEPTLVKIFDPNNLGSSCGSSKNPPPPRWILTLHRPEPVAGSGINPERRRRWWNALWGNP